MKSVQIIAGIACLALATIPIAQAQDLSGPDIDDPEERPDRHYDDDEKDKWIFGDGDPKTPEEIQREELMWEMDQEVQCVRGTIQGLIRGFYKNYDFELQQKCFGKDSVRYFYYVNWEF